MGTRRFEDRNQRTLLKTGNGSYTITLPIQLIRELRWQVRQELVIERKGNELVIKDKK